MFGWFFNSLYFFTVQCLALGFKLLAGTYKNVQMYIQGRNQLYWWVIG